MKRMSLIMYRNVCRVKGQILPKRLWVMTADIEIQTSSGETVPSPRPLKLLVGSLNSKKGCTCNGNCMSILFIANSGKWPCRIVHGKCLTLDPVDTIVHNEIQNEKVTQRSLE